MRSSKMCCLFLFCSMGELTVYGNGFLLFSNSQHIHRPVWLPKSCCYWSCIRFCWTPVKFFCKVKTIFFNYTQSTSISFMLILPSTEYEGISNATLSYSWRHCSIAVFLAVTTMNNQKQCFQIQKLFVRCNVTS